ncbi:MAG: winged helix-turn-helix transcriptional regulator [Parvularculaceae bacterium]|nr:winged helix-turn-helix transcriptional regulator [Parvularculaceae bacterium]
MKPSIVDRKLAALADPSRRRVIELLSARPRRAGELAEALGLPPPAMSRHLRALKEGGLVAERIDEIDSRVRIYALKDGAVDEVKAWLAATEALWSDQLRAFKKRVETKR